MRTNYCNIKGYKVYDTSRPNLLGKGGSALGVKENIKHYAKYETAEIQTTTVIVKIEIKDISIATIYCPTGKGKKKSNSLHSLRHYQTYPLEFCQYNAERKTTIHSYNQPENQRIGL